MTTSNNTLSPAQVLSCLVLGLAACDSATRFPGTLHTDSAGIAIATALEPLWAPGEGWTVSAEPLVEIGAATGAGEYLLDNVVGAARLSNGDCRARGMDEWRAAPLRQQRHIHVARRRTWRGSG